jgi:hypothetical protein
VKQAFERLQAVQVENDPSAILNWFDSYCQYEDFVALYPHQRVNKIPGMEVLCYKSTFFQALTRMKSLYPIFNFFPTTFQLPPQFSEFQREHHRLCVESAGSSCTWILKPRIGCCGNGIRLIQNALDAANQTKITVIQRYISPFLIDDRKFDFRFYVLISALHPLTVYVYNEGLARFCTHSYLAPTRETLDDRFCHLTNTAINVANDQSAHSILELASSVIRRIADTCARGVGLWDRIRQTVMLSIVAMYPGILQNIGMIVPNPKPELTPPLRPVDENRRYFHLLGIDIMLNDRCEPMVLEVNDRPSMCVHYPIENDLKTRVVFDVLNIVLAEGEDEPPLGGWESLLPMEQDSLVGSTVHAIVERSCQGTGTSPMKLVKKRLGNIPSTMESRAPKRVPVSLPRLRP